MAESQHQGAAVGAITWTDLTVPDAEEIKDFYHQVVGWTPEPVDMGGYDDFNMNAPGSGECVAGVCHARGANAGLPAQWLVYVTVADLAASLERCEALGGEAISGPRGAEGQDRFCVIRDPAGAVVALYEPGDGR